MSIECCQFFLLLFLASIYIIIFFIFISSIWYLTSIGFLVLNKFLASMKNTTWSWCIILFINVLTSHDFQQESEIILTWSSVISLATSLMITIWGYMWKQKFLLKPITKIHLSDECSFTHRYNGRLVELWLEFYINFKVRIIEFLLNWIRGIREREMSNFST